MEPSPGPLGPSEVPWPGRLVEVIVVTATLDRAERSGAWFTRRAWWSLLGFVPGFVLAFVVGEGLVAAFGYPTGGPDPVPWWAVLGAAVPALTVFALPAVLVVHLGRRAVALGDVRGKEPVIVALAVAGCFVLVNLASGLLVWVS